MEPDYINLSTNHRKKPTSTTSHMIEMLIPLTNQRTEVPTLQNHRKWRIWIKSLNATTPITCLDGTVPERGLNLPVLEYGSTLWWDWRVRTCITSRRRSWFQWFPTGLQTAGFGSSLFWWWRSPGSSGWGLSGLSWFLSGKQSIKFLDI